MASFLATPACPVATISTVPRATTGQQKNFSINECLSFFVQKPVPKIQFSKVANIDSSRSRCFRTGISCSLPDQPKIPHSVINSVPHLVATRDTLSIVQSTIAKQLSIDVSAVTPETKFADLGADSLDTVEIMMALEEQFGVSVGEGGAENIATVQDAADLIEKVKEASA